MAYRWAELREHCRIYYPINCVNLITVLKGRAYQLKRFTSAHIGTRSEWQAIKTQTRLRFTTGNHWTKMQFKFVNTLRGFGALTRVLEGQLDFGIFCALRVAVLFFCCWELDVLWVASGFDRVRRKKTVEVVESTVMCGLVAWLTFLRCNFSLKLFACKSCSLLTHEALNLFTVVIAVVVVVAVFWTTFPILAVVVTALVVAAIVTVGVVVM
jgi:hypothetical protein